jgi:hypothetical protein
MIKMICILSICYGIWYLFFTPGSISYGPGVFAPQAPIQQKTNSSEPKILLEGYTISPLATFELKAKVLSRKNYNLGRESDLSPTDLALGWGRMSDESVLESISISQSGRWYRWRSNDLPIPRQEIQVSSANMHIIPKNERVKEQLSQIRKGDVVTLSGSLVRVDASDGWSWVSSLTRNDTGDGACEVVLVDNIIIAQL